MKQSERFDLIDRVARELQSRFKTYELNAYLRSFGIDVGDTSQPISSKWVHAKGILSGVTLDVLLKVADARRHHQRVLSRRHRRRRGGAWRKGCA